MTCISLLQSRWMDSAAGAAIRKHCLGSLNNNCEKFIFSQFWRLAICGQGVSMADFFHSLSSWLADGRLLPLCHMVSPPWVSVLISSFKDTSHTGLGPTLMTSFWFHHLLKDFISKSSHILTYWGLEHQHTLCGGEHYSVYRMGFMTPSKLWVLYISEWR